MPGKLSNFWQELKRRNVVRVITVYTGAAFVILSLVDMIREPFELPNWSFKLVIVLLSIGLIIAVILSWIYDIHPEEGIVKTEPANKVKPEDVPESSNRWKIASYISFIVIVGLIVLNVIPRGGQRKNLDKSIAVLPLEYLSENPDKEYLANGVLDAITGHLSMIEGLRVMPRTSVEQYRERKKSAKEIGEELGVSYLIEGSFLMQDDHVKLIIQLVVAEEGGHLFFKEYDRDYTDIFAVQSEVAQTIAKEIEIAITPEEKQRIENVPTTSLTAYDFYQKGRDEQWNGNTDRAEELYHKALENDQAFAQAYNGLARIYLNRHRTEEEEYLSENYLDSVLILTDNALSYNPNLSETHVIRGQYYNINNSPQQARIEFEKALRLNPNDWEAYLGKANVSPNPQEALENMYKALRLNRGPRLPILLYGFSFAYGRMGFEEQCMKYAQQYLELTGDSANYYFLIAGQDHTVQEIETLLKAYRLDSTRWWVNYDLGEAYLFLRNYEEALKYFQKIPLESMGSTIGFHRIGLAYLRNGDQDKADYYFDKEIEISLAEIDLRRPWAEGDYYSYLDLASIYAIRGEKESAIENLRKFNQKEYFTLYILNFMYTDPSFDNIRDEPEFQQIVRDMEAKYQAIHEIISQWLEDNKESL